eukprot:m.67360 g.67360  ORF g.67360 m.67360 type:complete len:368 (+) comp11576_c0_seq14:952-2055(+)
MRGETHRICKQTNKQTGSECVKQRTRVERTIFYFTIFNLRSSSLPLSSPCTNDNKVERVSNAIQVILLQFQPRVRSLCNLIRRPFSKGLYHQALTAVFYTLVQKLPNLINITRHKTVGKMELTFHVFEFTPQRVATHFQRLFYKRLAVEINEIKCKQTHLDFDLILISVLALPCTEDLEGKDLRRVDIERNCFTVNHKVLNILFQRVVDTGDNIRVFGCVVLRVSAVYKHIAILIPMHLRPLSIVFVFTHKKFSIKPFQHLSNPFSWMCQHWFHRNSRCDRALIHHHVHTFFKHDWEDLLIVWKFIKHRLNFQCVLFFQSFHFVRVNTLTCVNDDWRITLAERSYCHSGSKSRQDRQLSKTYAQLPT